MNDPDDELEQHVAKTRGITEAAVNEALGAGAKLVALRFFVFALLSAQPVRNAMASSFPLPSESRLREMLGIESVTEPGALAPIGRTVAVTEERYEVDLTELVRTCADEGLRSIDDSASRAQLRLLRCLLSKDAETERMLVVGGMDTSALFSQLDGLLSD